MTTPKLSVCMIVRDEEDNLQNCLRSVSSVADEIVVVDTGSTDKSIEILQNYNKVRLIQSSWDRSFAEARNRSIREARGEWILVIDADEELSNPSAVKEWTTDSQDACFVLMQNFLPENSLSRYSWDMQMRLFRAKSSYKYSRRIQETIIPSIRSNGGRMVSSNLKISHFGFRNDFVQGQNSRVSRNLELINLSLGETPSAWYLYYERGSLYKNISPTKSRQDLHKALELGREEIPTYQKDQIHMWLSQAALLQNDWSEVIVQAQNSLNLCPHNITSRVCLITALISIGAFSVAIPDLEWMVGYGLELVPNPEDFLQLLNVCQTQAG